MKGRPHPEKPYTIMVRGTSPLRSRVDLGNGVRRRAAEIMKQLDCGRNVLLVSQKSIPESHRSELAEALSGGGMNVETMLLPEGEAAKDTSQLLELWSRMQTMNFTRHDCVCALGGGAVTDVAGFAAATYLRGVKLVLVPTTLLSQVDASIGGKTGINLSAGKNLAGSFYFPAAVVVDPQYLSTLPSRDILSGLGEIVKYALIERTVAENTDYRPGPRPFIDVIPQNFANGEPADEESLLALVACCVRMKLAVVLADPCESGLRRCLNLGHTLGHAIEKVSNYSVTHGESVAVGTRFALALACHSGRMPERELARFDQLLSALNLPASLPDLSPESLAEVVTHDKKVKGTNVKFVLPERELGRVSFDFDLPLLDFSRLLKDEFERKSAV